MDWKLLIQDLLEAGMKQTEIGKSVGLSQPSLSDLVHGRTMSVRWEVGQKLIALRDQRINSTQHKEAA